MDILNAHLLIFNPQTFQTFIILRMESSKKNCSSNLNLPILQQVVLHEGQLIDLVVFPQYLKYGLRFMQLIPTTTFSLIPTKSNSMQLTFYSSCYITFYIEDCTSKQIRSLANHLNSFFTQIIDDVREFFTPIKKLNHFATNSSTYFLVERNYDSVRILMKATNLKYLQDCPYGAFELRDEIQGLREGKYEDLQLMGVYETKNTNYVIYKSKSGLEKRLESANLERKHFQRL